MMQSSPHSTDTTPIVSVVIPVFNSATTLERAIRSALAQTLTAIEVLVIDDGSSDDSPVIAARIAQDDGRVRVHILPVNRGKSNAMNLAASLARGTWLAVLDADDRYLPQRLETLVNAGEAQGVDLVADNQLHTDDATGAVVRHAFNLPGEGRAVGLQDFIANSDPGAPFSFGILKPMIRVGWLRRTGLSYHPGAKLAEDFYYMLEFFIGGGRAWMVHAPLYDWTLPFSPSARRWTTTGSGAWRYDYRNALAVHHDYDRKFAGCTGPGVTALLRRREREYRVMIHYLDAQRILAETGDRFAALRIIATNPGTWPLLARRIAGRLARKMAPVQG